MDPQAFEIIQRPGRSSRRETPSPPPGSLVCAELVQELGNDGYRPLGTRDWLLIAVVEGRGRLENHPVDPGNLLLFPPGIPHDYGAAEDPGWWHNLWVHFVPRPAWVEWLHWPTDPRGVRHLRAAGDDLERVIAALRQMVEDSESASRRRSELAYNALERALLLLDDLNPKAHQPRDPRVRRALAFLAKNLSRPIGMADLERAVGLGRTRLTALFQQQVGVPPMRYLQQERLLRARERLAATDAPIGRIADELGFASAFYFSTQFRKEFGCSPTEYRSRAT